MNVHKITLNYKKIGQSLSLALLIFGFVSCQQTTVKTDLDENRYLELATLWVQSSAEVKALYHQGYNAAMTQLNNTLQTKKPNEVAIIADLDETVVDNSPYQAMMTLTGKNYPHRWDEWMKKADAKALPGAVEFFNAAQKMGVKIYYISNRKEKYLNETKENLKKIGIPFEDDNLLLRTTTNDKEPRRKMISEKYYVALYLGDNTEDFPLAFDNKTVQERDEIVSKNIQDWGTRYIVFPNPTYGSFLSAVYHHNWEITPQQMQKLRESYLRDF